MKVPPETILSVFETGMRRLDEQYPGFLPDFAGRRSLLLGSDYSGDSPDAPYVVFSHLFTSFESWAAWEPVRLDIREAVFSDSRRMSFKRLGDGQRRRALAPILEAANSLEGLSFSIAVSKQCAPFFPSPPLDFDNPEFAPYLLWKPAVLQKAFFIVHTIGSLLAGLAHPGQNVMWLTDEDAVAANDQRICDLTNLFAWVASLSLEFDLGHIRCGTSRCDDGSRQIEDFLSLPDLIAGALAEQLTLMDHADSFPQSAFAVMRPDLTDKAGAITWWLSDARPPLRRLVCIIEPGDQVRWRLSWYHFMDQD